MCVCVCVCVCVFTVWYMCTPVVCDSRYTQSTVSKLTPRPVAVLSGLIDHYHNFASIFLPFEKCSYFTDCFFMSFDSTVVFSMKVAYVFGIY